jgi:hypothetical protein
MKTIIHVNQHTIKSNLKNKKKDPVISIIDYKSIKHAHKVQINGPVTIIYSPDKPLSCGARVWIETQSTLNILE